MTTVVRPSTWHYNPDIPLNPELSGATCLWTRNRPPQYWADTRQVRDFTEEQRVMAVSVHEAGHTVMHLHRGVEVLMAEVDENPDGGGRMAYRTDPRKPFETLATAAGERAEDRWLHESGLWTEDRAWVAERVAWSDRALVSEFMRGNVTYGTDPGSMWDYANVCRRTDYMLDGLWVQVMQLARYLARYRKITGDEAAAAADMTNYRFEG